MDELRRLLAEHTADRWQERWNGRDVGRVPLNLVDPDIVGLVQRCVGGSKLYPDQMKMLRDLRDDVSAVIAGLPVSDRPYFERLRRMADLALEASK